MTMESELNYAQSLLFKLSALQKDSVLCDVDINVCGEVFHAHRVLLSAASPYFQVMFCAGMVETLRREVVLQGFSSKTFAMLLEFIYSGKISVTSGNVENLLAAAKMLQLDNVVEDCCKFLINELSPNNCLGIFFFSRVHSCKHLSETALNFIQRNFEKVARSDEFLQIDLSSLLMFVKSDEIKVNQEEDVFAAVVKWILYDVHKRCDYIGQLFEHVKLPLLSPECVERHFKLCENDSINKIMSDCYQENLKHQQLPENTLYRCPRTHSQKYFYIIGGYSRKPVGLWSETVSLADLERFNVPSTTTTTRNSTTCGCMPICSTTLSPMNHPRNSLGVAALNGLIYAIGGENDSLIYDSVECYNPVLDQWNLVASMVAPRAGLGACVVDSEIYVIGGWIGCEIAKAIEKYNPDDNCWVVVGDVVTPRYHAGVCELKGMVYVVGGMDDTGEDLQTADCYDPIREKWSSIAPMHHKRSCVTVVSFGTCIYAIGGCNGSEGSLDSVEKYDVEKNLWEEVDSLPCARVSACAANSGSCIFVFGGRTLDYPPEVFNNIECYDTISNKWYSVAKLGLKRSEAGVVIF